MNTPVSLKGGLDICSQAPWMVEPINDGEYYQITTTEAVGFAIVAETPLDGTGRDAANARLMAASPDHALLLRAMVAGVARWTHWKTPDGKGEVGCDGILFCTELDEFGCPILDDMLRATLRKVIAEAEKKGGVK